MTDRDRQAGIDRARALLRRADRQAALEASSTLPTTAASAIRPGRGPAVTIDAGQAYALGATGHMHCLDAAGRQRRSGIATWNSDYEIRNADLGYLRRPADF